MFCNNCGKENPNGSQVCMECGTPLQAPTAPPVQPNTAKQSKGAAVAGILAAIIADVKAVDKKVMAKAISVLLAVLTVFTMMMGWAKIKSDPYNETYNVFQFRRAISASNESVQESLDEYDDMDIFDNASVKKLKSTGIKLTISSILLILDILVYWIAFLALAGFIFLMMIKNKYAAFLGQLACVIVALTVILFAIAVLIVGKLKFNMAFGLFVPLLAAAGNFLLITMKKNEIRA